MSARGKLLNIYFDQDSLGENVPNNWQLTDFVRKVMPSSAYSINKCLVKKIWKYCDWQDCIKYLILFD